METHKRKIGVLVEDHFDETEYNRFNEFFPKHGYEVEYISYLWGNKQLKFKGNDFTAEVTVTTDVNEVEPADYKAILLIGAYAMDRLRYEEHVVKGQPNQAPAVKFLRKAVHEMDHGNLKVGTICHSLWLFCADPTLLRGRKVTCAHNIMSDVENAGGVLVYEGNQLANTHVDGNLITGRHPGVIDEFLNIFLEELSRAEAV